MGFKKGYISTKKGKTFEEMYGKGKAKEIKMKISSDRKEFIPWNKGLTKETSEKVMEWSIKRKGHTVSKETREKIKRKNLGHKVSKETRKKLSEKHKGKRLSKEHKRKISEANKGKLHGMWKGGRIRMLGYILINSPNHPNKNSLGYVREHRLIVEKKIGRYLKKGEVIHHINEIKDDNRIENLMLFPNESEHMKLHRLKNKKNKEKV